MRLTLHIDDGICPEKALRAVEAVIRGGKVSDHGRAYCCASRCADGTMILARCTKAGHSFQVRKAATGAQPEKEDEE